MLGCRPHRRQPSARLAFAEEHVGQGVAELLAGNQATSTAGTSSIQGSSTGAPAFTTTTVRGLTAATRRTSSSWRPGRARESRSKPSLSTSSVVPTTTTAASASAASATACSSSSSSEACLARLSWKVRESSSASPNPPVSLGR